MNPPYKKIHSESTYRHSLRDLGIETINTYSAFMALAIKLLAYNGILTAIVPRSFCNGLYFLPFRKFILENTAILHIHSFESRDNAFRDENVLQENIIIVLKKLKRNRIRRPSVFPEINFFLTITKDSFHTQILYQLMMLRCIFRFLQ